MASPWRRPAYHGLAYQTVAPDRDSPRRPHAMAQDGRAFLHHWLAMDNWVAFLGGLAIAVVGGIRAIRRTNSLFYRE